MGQRCWSGQLTVKKTPKSIWFFQPDCSILKKTVRLLKIKFLLDEVFLIAHRTGFGKFSLINIKLRLLKTVFHRCRDYLFIAEIWRFKNLRRVSPHSFSPPKNFISFHSNTFLPRSFFQVFNNSKSWYRIYFPLILVKLLMLHQKKLTKKIVKYCRKYKNYSQSTK